MKYVKSQEISNLLKDVKLPKMFHAVQEFKKDRIEPERIPALVYEQLSRPEISRTVKPGMEIAITAGSRGVANVDVITKAIVDFCKEKGAKPFIVPAMGSHGGATPEGQLEVLAGFNITEETMDAPSALPWRRCFWDTLSTESRCIRIRMPMRLTASSCPAASSPTMPSGENTKAVS